MHKNVFDVPRYLPRNFWHRLPPGFGHPKLIIPPFLYCITPDAPYFNTHKSAIVIFYLVLGEMKSL